MAASGIQTFLKQAIIVPKIKKAELINKHIQQFLYVALLVSTKKQIPIPPIIFINPEIIAVAVTHNTKVIVLAVFIKK